MTRPSRSLPGFLLAAMLAAPASAQDLTGTWRAENGTRYVVLQSGEEFCWYAEPTSLFCGRVLGSLIVGSWLDLPTSFSRSGRMVLRIESPNRLIKVYQTANYPVSIWTREGTVPGPVAQLPPPPPPPQLPPPTPTVTPAAGPAPIPGGDLEGRWLREPLLLCCRGGPLRTQVSASILRCQAGRGEQEGE